MWPEELEGLGIGSGLFAEGALSVIEVLTVVAFEAVVLMALSVEVQRVIRGELWVDGL